MLVNTLLISKPFRFIVVFIISLCSLSLAACQKTPEPEPVTETDAKTTPVATSLDTPINATDIEASVQESQAQAAERKRQEDLAQLENNIGAEGVTPNAETTTPSPEQAIKGTQITDVRYKSAAGATISVVFETSSTGVLNAIVSLPNKPKMTLSAPEGQGNNPTYRSIDGSVELVSHGGGISIDLMQNNTMTNFEAISAEAEVVVQP